MEGILIEQARYRYRIIDNSKGETLVEGHGGPEDLANLFPGEIHEFLKKEIDRGRLVDTTLKMKDFAYEVRKTVDRRRAEIRPAQVHRDQMNGITITLDRESRLP